MVAQASEAAVDTLADHRLRAVQLRRDRRIWLFVDDAGADRHALIGRQVFQQSIQMAVVAGRAELLHPGQVVVLEQDWLKRQALPCRLLDARAPHAVAELVGRNREQP